MATSKDSIRTSRPLNAIGPEPYRFGKLTEEQIEELTQWFMTLHSNTDPDKALPVPEFYKPITAYMHLQGIGIEMGDLLPWTMPSALVDYCSDLWCANRVSILRVIAANGGVDVHKGKGSSGGASAIGPLFGGPIKPDRQGGHA